MTPLDREGFVELVSKAVGNPGYRDNVIAMFDALLAAERERCKQVFIWRDGQPYYDTANQIPMEIPKRVKRKIAAAWRKEA